MSRASKVKRRIWAAEGDYLRRKTDFLVTEEPLEIRLRAGGAEQTVAITMRTPGADYELAAGFLYNEGVIEAKDLIDHMTYCVGPAEGGETRPQEYNQLVVKLRLDHLPPLPQLERHFMINSACGLCGKASLDALAERDLAPIPPGPVIPQERLYALPEALRAAQSLFDNTGGLHAAALFDQEGRLVTLREDVGRHNALDKLVGWALLNQKLPFHDHILMVSGRASFELLQKCLSAGAPIFCAVSAPSSLALSLAQRFGITLVGFLRENRFNLYTGPDRIVRWRDE